MPIPKKTLEQAEAWILEQTVRFAAVRKTQNAQFTPDSTTWFNNQRYTWPEWKWYDKGKQPAPHFAATTQTQKSVLDKMAEQRSGTR